MARTTWSPQDLVRTGLTATYRAGQAAGGGGDGFYNDGRVFILVKNSGAETTLTIQTPGTVDGLAVPDRTVTIPATTGEKFIGPFQPEHYNQSDGMVYLDWSQVTGITFAVVRMV